MSFGDNFRVADDPEPMVLPDTLNLSVDNGQRALPMNLVMSYKDERFESICLKVSEASIVSVRPMVLATLIVGIASFVVSALPLLSQAILYARGLTKYERMQESLEEVSSSPWRNPVLLRGGIYI